MPSVTVHHPTTDIVLLPQTPLALPANQQPDSASYAPSSTSAHSPVPSGPTVSGSYPGNVGHVSPPSSARSGAQAGAPSPSSASSSSPAPLMHPMLTRARASIFKPNPRYAPTATADHPSIGTISPLPSSVRVALRDPNWRVAMKSEYRALLSNKTWRLVDRPPGAHIISGKWVFTHKLKHDGSLDRYKARWVVRGFTRAGVDR